MKEMLDKVKDFWQEGTWQKVVLIAAPILLLAMFVKPVRAMLMKIPVLGSIVKMLPNMGSKPKRRRTKRTRRNRRYVRRYARRMRRGYGRRRSTRRRFRRR